MSGYTEIKDQAEGTTATMPAVAPIPPAPQVYAPTSQTFSQPPPQQPYVSAGAAEQQSYGSIGFGPAAILSNIAKLVALVGVFIVGVGVLVGLSGFSNAGLTMGWVELAAIVAPCALLLIAFNPGAPTREHLLLVAAIMALVNTIWTFFYFCAVLSTDLPKHTGAYRAMAAGMFFMFVGEGIVSGIAFYARGRDI